MTNLCGQELADVPELDPTAASAARRFAGGSPRPSAATAPPAGARPAVGERAGGALSGWLADHLPVHPTVEFVGSRAALRAVTLLCLAATVALGVLAPPAALAGVALYAVLGASLYRSTTERRAKTKYLREEATSGRELKRATRRRAELSGRAAQLDRQDRAAARASMKRGGSGGTLDEDAERPEPDETSIAATRSDRLAAIDAEEAAARAAALETLRRDHYRAALTRHRLELAPVTGLDEHSVAALAEVGIVTAGDFTGLVAAVSDDPGGASVFRLADGSDVTLAAVPRELGVRIEEWRRYQALIANAALPTELPPWQSADLRAGFEGAPGGGGGRRWQHLGSPGARRRRTRRWHARARRRARGRASRDFDGERARRGERREGGEHAGAPSARGRDRRSRRRAGDGRATKGRGPPRAHALPQDHLPALPRPGLHPLVRAASSARCRVLRPCRCSVFASVWAKGSSNSFIFSIVCSAYDHVSSPFSVMVTA